ncbi:MAG TPA: hypothetical protein ACFCUC_06800 [Desulfobacterales bacterium]|jgi:hypothetical protein
MELSDAQLLTIVKNVVEQHGCRLVSVDFEKQRIDLEGPEEAKGRCARALAEVLG